MRRPRERGVEPIKDTKRVRLLTTKNTKGAHCAPAQWENGRILCAYIIFLCNFKPKKDDKFYELYHTYSDQDRSKQLQDGVTKIIINSQVSAEGQSEDLKALAKLMNNEPVKLNKHFDYAQRRIKEINEDPETREKIMLYETRMLERKRILRY